ncbi:hypothetical protein Hypma_003410 [Hypsizygus marmoreus]|uniref:Uncharacterized protein n=1 Tax=Hypsizygus marmoreus TaxID=39966 RepID=A0A369J674_HYPMA|nr:hypothetical protein Hypma_003410 [Hypsizygus marmoreus]
MGESSMGNRLWLNRYFEDVTLLAESGSLVGKEIIKIALPTYVRTRRRGLMVSIGKEEADEDWEAFKKAITKLYPGS